MFTASLVTDGDDTMEFWGGIYDRFKRITHAWRGLEIAFATMTCSFQQSQVSP